MPKDAQGLSITAASAAAATAYDHVIEGYLKYRADAGQRLKALLTLDAEMPMAQVLKGAFGMLAYNTAQVPRAKDAAAAAARLAGNDRERAHAAALALWAEGDVEGALAAWEAIIAAHPHDILAFRLHHFCAFWLGRVGQMVRAVEGIAPRWSAAIPGYGSILACRCFAQEESGNYTLAEEAGRAAVALDPGDLWAAHGVAHVMEMQGRRGEGISWLTTLEPHLGGRPQPAASSVVAPRAVSPRAWRASPTCSNSTTAAFATSPRRCTVAAARRLHRRAERRLHAVPPAAPRRRCRQPLGGTGRQGRGAHRRLPVHLHPAALDDGTDRDRPHRPPRRMVEAMREFAKGPAPSRPSCATTRCRSARRCSPTRRTTTPRAVALMRPAIGGMYRMGGSHAQQDVLEQLFVDAAVKAGAQEDARLLLERVAGRHPVPPERRAGYAQAALAVAH